MVVILYMLIMLLLYINGVLPCSERANVYQLYACNILNPKQAT